MITEASAAPTLSVSIVLHNSKLELLEAALRSLHRSVQKAGNLLQQPVEVILLDNQSAQAYRDALARLLASLRTATHPWLSLRLQLNAENTGFGSGHNAALQDCHAQYILVLNPDVELAADALVRALDYLQTHRDTVALNPRGERGDGSREYLCKRYPSLLDLLLRGLPLAGLRRYFDARLARYEYRDLNDDEAQGVCLLSGACLLCRGADFAALGGFDSRFFMYFEDFDLSRRLARRGALVYLPGMQIVHHGGFAARKGRRHIQWFVASALRFFHLHGWRVL
jgi:GT2 family glycosyltransferase